MTPSILIIGGGNMGGALAQRWQSAGFAVHVVEKNEHRRTELTQGGLSCYATCSEAPHTDLVVLAIKPQQFTAQPPLLHAPLAISIMAGITLTQLTEHSPHVSWVRIMPNLPSMIGEGMSIACAPHVTADQRAMVDEVFATVGHIGWVEKEEDLHAVTAISGSGPAYVFAFMEALENAAQSLGMDAALARQLVTQTVKGAALLADQSTDDVATLRRNVTSPSGTTEAAIAQFQKHGLSDMVKQAAHAAADRSRALAK